MNEVEFLEHIIKNIVQNPDDVNIESKDDELGTLLTLKVNEDDMRLVIGKGGATINSIKTVLRMFGAKSAKKINLRVEG